MWHWGKIKYENHKHVLNILFDTCLWFIQIIFCFSLLFAVVKGNSQDIIGGYIEKIAKNNQMTNGNLGCASLITRVHGLRGSQQSCHIFLRKVIILT